MPRTTYSFKNLRGHTTSIRNRSARLIQAKQAEIEMAFGELNSLTTTLEQQPVSLQRNVELLATCKFANHICAAIHLTEAGLTVDAMLCTRNALEMVAFRWLLLLDPNAAEEYHDEERIQPAVVRRRLEQLGAEIGPIRDWYSDLSGTTHVGTKANRFQARKNGPKDWSLNFGGRFEPEHQNYLLILIVLFIRLYINPMMRTPPV